MSILGLGYGLCATIMSILGDFYLKRAAEGGSWRDIVVGAALYAGSTLPWYFAICLMSLTSIAVVYSVMTILCLTTLGVLVFDEPMTRRAWVALAFALAAIVISEGGT